MKKTLFSLFLLFCFAEAFTQTVQKWQNLTNYMWGVPGSFIPMKGEEITIPGGVFAVVDQHLNGEGIDYLIIPASSKLISQTPKPIYIYGENIKTRKSTYYDQSGRLVSEIVITGSITIVSTGTTAPAISGNGNRIEVPVFIEKGL